MKELKIELQVKPLSANKMYWRGKRSKTAEYLAYQNEIRDELMGTTWPFSDSPLHFVFDVGLSARQADLDNTFKPLFDTLQTIYDEFNDNKVYTIAASKYIVPKGREFIRLGVTETTEPQAQLTPCEEQAK